MHEPLYRYCLLVFLCMLLPTNVYGQVKKPHDAPNRPNVVLILVDDAGLMDFEPYGGEAKMPALTSLAQNSIMFTNCRTSPLCSPSRAMLLTGDASGADNWEQKPYIPYYDTAPWFEDDKAATLPDDFYSSQFIVDKMIDYIGQRKGPEQPNEHIVAMTGRSLKPILYGQTIS